MGSGTMVDLSGSTRSHRHRNARVLPRNPCQRRATSPRYRHVGGSPRPRRLRLLRRQTVTCGVMIGPTHEKTLLIRPEYLNHIQTVFGGYMMQWADDMAFNAAS